MQGWQTTYLGMRELPRDISGVERQAFFTFSPAERALIEARRSDHHKLGLALHIGLLRMSGRLLDAFRIVPPALWRHLGSELDIEAPELASLRALYGRGRTLFDHQQVACEALGFRWMSEHQRRALVRLLGDEVSRCADRDQLLVFARHWLYEHRLLIVHDRAIRTLIAAALVHLEAETAAQIRTEVQPGVLQRWCQAVAQPHTTGQTRQSWLWAPPAKHSTRQISEVLERIDWLYGQNVHKFLGKLPDLLVRRYARRMASRPPSAGAKIKEPARTVEVACFLRYCLLSTTDQLILMIQRRVADLWRQAAASRGDTVNWANFTVAAGRTGGPVRTRRRSRRRAAHQASDLGSGKSAATPTQPRVPGARAADRSGSPCALIAAGHRQAAMAGHGRSPGRAGPGHAARSVHPWRANTARINHRARLGPGMERHHRRRRPGTGVPGAGGGHAVCAAPIGTQRLGVDRT